MPELIGIAFSLGLLLFTFVMGKVLETRYSKHVAEREAKFAHIIATSMKTLPPDTKVEATTLVIGSVAVAPSYWRRFLAGFRLFFGGEVKSISFELNRGRREARVRMLKDAASKGCNVVINTRFETSMLTSTANNKGLAIVEMMAYGTGVRVPQ